MRIWIDADRVPRSAREIVERAGDRLGMDVSIVSRHEGASAPDADTGDVHGFPRKSVEAGDLVVTGDDTLGRDLARGGVVAVHPRGDRFEATPAESAQSTHDLLASIRSLTTGGTGPPPYDERAKRRFAATLDRILAHLTRP